MKPASSVPQQGLSCHPQCAGAVVPLAPHSAHDLWGQVAPYTGLHYNAGTWACSEPVDSGTNCLTSSLKPHSVLFHCQPLSPQHPSAGVLLYSAALWWHVDFSFFAARLGLPTAPAVCVHLSPLTELPARTPPHFCLPQPRLEVSCLAGSCQVYPFAFIFISQGPSVPQLSARQLPERRADHKNMRLRDKQDGLRNVLRFAKIT